MAALTAQTRAFGPAKASRSRSVAVRASSRPLWLPGAKVPAHLDGKLAGDFGFDPLGLGKDPKSLHWYQAAELVHGRTAMTAVAGIVIPGLLTKAGVLNVPQWYEAGKVYVESPGAIPFGSLFISTFFFSGFAEMKRYQDIIKPGSQAEKGTFFGLESAFKGPGPYPGGPFDFLGFAKNSKDDLKEYKLKEIKNGRLAMLAFLGFAAQYSATGKGPIDNLIDHVADPWHTTFAENGVSVPGFPLTL